MTLLGKVMSAKGHLREANRPRQAKTGSRSAARPKKKLVRRTDRDYSQQLRLGFQLAFLALNVWIGVQFYQWVRWAETAGQTGPSSVPPASRVGCPSPG